MAKREMTADSRLVYSTDTKLNEKCARCKELKLECTCPPEIELKSFKFVVKLRIEKQGRGGKVVTVLEGLPKIEVFLKSLTTELKKNCGSGGTFSMAGRDGIIEIQGDKRETLREILLKKGMKVKG